MNPEIKHSNNEKNGIFEVYVEGKKAGEMTYVWAGPEKFIIDHTEVDENFGGMGLGKKLVYAAVDFAREKNIKILPLCPYAKATLEKDESVKDVLA